MLSIRFAESRILRRGVLGDRVDGRSREGRFLTKIERELTQQVGVPSFGQVLLIRRLARAALRLELIDERSLSGTLSDHDARSFSVLSNQVRLLARELGLRAAPSEAPASLDVIVSRHKAAAP